VVYTTGYSPEAFDREMLFKEDINFLQKPYHPQKLAQVVRNCLDQE